MGGDNGKTREGLSGTTLKDTWTKPRVGGIQGREVGLAGVGERSRGKMQKIVLEQH